MSLLEQSEHSFFTLEQAGPEVFRAEVDRFVKAADNGNDKNHCRPPMGPAPSPSKRARLDNNLPDESGYGSQLASSQSQSQPGSQGAPPNVPGVIIEVKLENFLCHDEFKITLNKRLNFIVGVNGSGKSAVLTGIVVALGGSAFTTGRGTTLKDFVKYHCQYARVTVTLSNTGPFSFCREQYGNKIIVARTIDNQGRSKVEMKTEHGKTMSTKMQDLKAMCLKLGIQVENPVSVLDQNTAKTFFLQNNPSKLYSLFMRATDLDSLRLIHEDIEKLRLQTDQEIRKKTKDFENNNAELNEVTRKYEILKNFEKDKVKEDILRMELLKAQERESLLNLSNAQEALKKAGNERLQLQKVVSSDSESQELLKELEDAKENARVLANQQEEAETNFKTIETKYRDNLKEQKRCGTDLKQVEIKMQHNERMISEFKGEITSLEKKLQPSLVQDKREVEAEVFLLSQTLKQCEDNQSQLKTKIQNLQESINNLNDSVVELRAQERSVQKLLGEKEKALQALQEDRSDYSRFGRNMTELIKLIEENTTSGKFKEKPVGPLGLFIKVKEPQWVLAIECALKSRLNNFVVGNLHDERLLRSLMSKAYRGTIEPGIIRLRILKEPLDTSKRAARTPQYPNILDMIEVKELTVRNTLIEIFHIESTLLIPEDDDCHNLLKDFRTVPKNCSKAFTLQGSSYFPDPAYRTYHALQDKAKILDVSRQSLIEDMSNIVIQLKNQLNELRAKSSSTLVYIQNSQEQLKKTKTEENKNIKSLLDNQTKLDNLKDSEKSDTSAISTLKEDLAERERKQEEYKAMISKLAEQLETLQQEKRDLKTRGAEYKERVNCLKKENQPLIIKQNQIKELLTKVRSCRTDSENRINQIKKQELQLASTVKELEATYNTLNHDSKKFEAHLCSEGVNLQEVLNTSRDLRAIDLDLKAVIKQRSSVERSFGKNIDEIEREYYETFEIQKRVKNEIKILKKNSISVREALETRLNLYCTQRKYIAAIVSHQFTRVLIQRNCTGNIKVNFKEKTLQINVGPIDQGETAGLGTSSLSGGERSYTTVAFVIALWLVTELPFYYMDECDVFMDPVNRQTILNLLIKFARQKRGHQFGLLTPLDTSTIKEAEDLSIWRLDDPRVS